MMGQRLEIRAARLASIGLVACACSSASDRASPEAPSTAVTPVAVVDVAQGRILENQTVVIRDSLIVAVGPADDVRAPEGAEVLDGRGRFLAPGFADMHVHLYTEGDLFTYVANGITTVRNMAGDSTHLLMRRRVNEGAIVGPRIVTAGPVVEAAPLSHPDNALVERPDAVRAELVRQRGAGYDFIKVYNHLDRSVYDSLVTIAAELQLPVAGHVPVEIGIEDALRARQRSIEHFRGYIDALVPANRALPPDASFRDRSVAWLNIDSTRIANLVAQTVAAGTWNVPTFTFSAHELAPASQHARLLQRPEARHLSLMGLPRDRSKTGYLEAFTDADYAATQRGLERQFQLLRALDAAGAGLLAGTDSWLAGHAFADELTLLVRAGLSPARVIRMATLDAARFLGEHDRRGTVTPGHRADLVLLDANPLVDIAAVRRVHAVVVNGRVLARADIDARLKALADSLQARDQ